MTTTLKHKLLLGTALVAVGAFAATAANAVEITGTVAAPNDLTGTIAASDLLNAVDDQAAADDAAHFDVDGNLAATNINIDTNATVGFYDNNGGDAITFSGYADVASGTTLTLIGGGSLADGTGTNGGGTAQLIITGALAQANATTQVRGGTLTLVGVANNDAGGVQTLTVNGNTLMTAVNVTGGAGGAGAAGAAVVGNFGDASSDTFNVTGYTVKGGAGAANAGGAATSTVTAAATIGTTGLTVTGGDAGAAAVGGAATVSFANGATLSGATVVTGGNDAAGNNGGNAALTFGGTTTSTSTLTVRGGAETSGGTAGTATVTFNGTGNKTFTAITLDQTVAGNATLITDVTTDNTGDFTVTGTINGAATAEGVLTISDDSAANADTVTFASNIGATHSLALINVGATTNEGGHGIFNGTVAAATITIGQADSTNEAVSADFNGNVTATTTNVVADSDANVDTTVTFARNVTSAIVFADAGGGTGAPIVRYDGTTAQTQTGAITTGNDNIGRIIVGNTGTNSNVTFVSNIGAAAAELDTLTVVSGSSALIGSVSSTTTIDSWAAREAHFNGEVTIDGTLNVGQNVTLTSTTGTMAGTPGSAVGTLGLYIGTSGAVNTFVDQAATVVLTGQAVNWNDFDGTTANTQRTVLRQGSGTIHAGDEYLIADGNAIVTNLNAAGEQVRDEFALFDFTGYMGNAAAITTAGADNTQVYAEARVADLNSVTVNSNNAHTAAGLLGVSRGEYSASAVLGGAGDNGELARVYDNVTRHSTATIDEALESIQSTVDGGNVVAATNVNNHTSDLIQTRLAALSSGETGATAGNVANGLRIWGQVFGETAEQDTRDTINGYDADTYGVAVGIDTSTLADKWIWGLAFAYGDTDVDSKNANTTETEVDTYQVALYANYDIDEATYVSGQLSYAFGENDIQRNNVGGVSGLTARGDFDSDTFGARAEVGRAYEVGQNTTLVPNLSANYMHYDADGYTETGAGGASLHVDQDELNIFELGAAVDASWMYQQASGGYLKPELRAGVRYDFIGDEVEATQSFVGGGTAFQTEGADDQHFALDLGAGVTYFTADNWEFTANYDFEWKEEYTAHAGYLRAGYKF